MHFGCCKRFLVHLPYAALGSEISLNLDIQEIISYKPTLHDFIYSIARCAEEQITLGSCVTGV